MKLALLFLSLKLITPHKYQCDPINILVIGVIFKGVAFPILFKMMNRFGNSNCAERIEIIEK